MRDKITDLKIQFQGKSKKVNPLDIDSYESLVAVVHNKFPTVPQDCDIYYFDSEEDRL